MASIDKIREMKGPSVRHLILLITVMSGPLIATAHSPGAGGISCRDAGLTGSAACPADVLVIANGVDAPLSDAAVELRNSIAPQSNYAARTIQDDSVFAAQVVLRKNGCYDGRLDGVLAEGTVYAIKLFEANMGLVPTGALGADTQTALRQSHDRFDVCR